MGYLPLHFKLKGKKLLFIGGGKVNERRIKKILELEPKVDITLISPRITDALMRLVDLKRIRWIAEEFDESLLDEEYSFVFVGVDREAEKIVKAVRNKGYAVENASCGESGDFIFPAVIEREGVVVSISTSGRDPSLTKAIREKIEDCLKEMIK
ncbi:MAG: bifunctional precorrin-2 dehydrogenase/sirohydrochlorin ferrochelatase [Deferribacteres bacterium]|nr:bifunctional precorrin-2 dehydrogenase/sirohydrochlorin ferrochelatase [Deferribacteres bacterium]